VIKTAETMSVEVQRGISRILRQHPDVHELRVFVNPVLLERLRKEDEEALVELERRFGGRLAFRADPKLRAEEFIVVNALTEEELK
jgi:ribonuclease G